MRRLLIPAFLLLAPSPSPAQGAIGARLTAVRTATAAGDHAEAVRLADSIARVAPGHPQVAFVRAITLGAAGRDTAAAAAVRTLLRWDARFARRALQESVLAAAGRLLAGTNVDSLAALADRPLSRGSVYATIPERDLVLEGTAYDPATRSLLVGSLHKAKVLAIAADGAITERIGSRAHGLNSIVGIHVDSARGLLWVTSARRFDTPTDTATPALFAFDAATGTFRRRVNLPAGDPFPNDVTTARDGTVFLTDSRGGKVLRLRPGAETFEELDGGQPWVAPNGITIDQARGQLFVSDFDHIRVVDLGTGRARRLETPDSINVSGVDGLAFVQGSLIAHHPLTFWRVVRYDLDAGSTRITGLDYLERNTPDSRTSTTGEVVGGMYNKIGNSQIDRMNLRTIDPATMEPIRIYRAPIRP